MSTLISSHSGEMLDMIYHAIFQGLHDDERYQFSIAFHRAIPVGTDVLHIGLQFLDRLLNRLFSQPYAASVADACQAARDVVAAMARSERVDKKTADAAHQLAFMAFAEAAGDCCYAGRDVACAAAYAAEAAAFAIISAVEVGHAYNAFDAAVCAARAADAVEKAANAASEAKMAEAVAKIYAVEDAYAIEEAKANEYRAQASDLLELLAAAPVPNTEDGQ